MILFKFKALNKDGIVVNGIQAELNENDLKKTLKNKGLLFISATSSKTSIKKPIEDFTIPFLTHLRQLIGNSLDLPTALDIVSQIFMDHEAKTIVLSILSSIKDGCTLSISLSKFDLFFDKLSVKTIEIAEKTSGLPEALQKIIEYLLNKVEITKKIKNAVRYPIILFFCVFCVMLFWLIVIVPKFADLFAELDVSLPLLTKIVIALSSFLSQYFLYITIFLFTLIVWLSRSISNKSIREKLLRKIPIAATMSREIFAMNFFTAMEMLLKEKVHLIEGLECVASVENSDAIMAISESIKNGNNLSDSMGKSGLFSNYEVSIISTGEASGDLWPTFKVGADMLRLKLKDKSKKIISMIQPITIAFIGILLVLIAYSVIVPMYSNLDFCL
ncbi:MAG: type II secretion system F family protein [Holosporales bacterium]|jgi:type II secretory pathway component PulF|nr:type II secretion system F family protein [Holosporales bacterium]